MQNLKVLLGKKIKEYRKRSGYTQEQLAEMIGIGTPNISYIETGKYAPSMETLAKLSEIFNVSPYELYMFEHLKSVDELKQEILEAMEKDDNLVKVIYKFYKYMA